MPHNVSEGNIYKYILTGVDVASRYKIARALGIKKVLLHLCWKQYTRKVLCLNIQKYSNVIMGLCSKS